MEQYCMYLRKSRADAEAEARGEGETLARHEHTLQEFAKRRHLPVVKIYREIVSGDSIASRPQMQQLLHDLEEGMYNGVLVMEVERLARGNTIDQGIVAEAFKSTDTKIITPVKTYDPNNEFDEEYFEFSLFMSRREYKTIKRRMQAGRVASVKEGNYIGTNPPYGYKKISPAPKVRTLEIIDEEAEVVRMIFDMYLNEGLGAKAIAAKLNSLMIQPQKSLCWESVSIRKILKNPVYAGKIRWHTQKDGEILSDGYHKAIIPYDMFCSVQKRIEQRSVPQVQTGTELKNYYHNILFCANCGCQMRRRPAKNREGYMLCLRNECRGKVTCAAIELINEAVMSAIQMRINELTLEISEQRTEKNIHEPKKADMVKQIEASMGKLKKQKDKLYTFLETDVYTVEVFVERMKALEEQEKTLQSELDRVRAENEMEENSLDPDSAILFLQQVLDEFPSASAARKNELLRKVIRRINYRKTERMCKNKMQSDMNLDVAFL
ncbi:MAG: recombinase family protein [Ruminococcus sp.]